VRNEVRIIGGQWRSRKLLFPDVPGLRPTPSRARETLFNWLRNDVQGAHCLNLYAGSGVLGFEAASRGAELVVQVENNPRACAFLKDNCIRLGAYQLEIVQADVGRYLAASSQPFDLVFVDPPFAQGLAAACCRTLERQGWLAENAKIYVETESGLSLCGLPENWETLRSDRAGNVRYHLFARRDGETPRQYGSSNARGRLP
jgi:16S rRNA (guanine966-N2)-methyltransferase